MEKIGVTLLLAFSSVIILSGGLCYENKKRVYQSCFITSINVLQQLNLR
jgi:hypothetical protein